MKTLFFLFCNVLLAGDTWVPHITGDSGGFATFLEFRNYGSSATVTIHPVNGQVVSVNVPAGESHSVQGVPSWGAARVVMPENVALNVVYENLSTGSRVSVTASEKINASWHVKNSREAGTWTGFAVVNAGEKEGSISISGPVLEVMPIGAGEKITGVFEEAGDYLISANQPLSVLALKGTDNGELFWSHAAAPIVSTALDRLGLLFGQWVFEYDICGTRYERNYRFSEFTSTGLLAGTNTVTGAIVGGLYSETLGALTVLEVTGGAMNRFYVFNVGTGNDFEVGSCYFQVNAGTNDLDSGCLMLAGSKRENLSKESAAEEVAQGAVQSAPVLQAELGRLSHSLERNTNLQ